MRGGSEGVGGGSDREQPLGMGSVQRSGLRHAHAHAQPKLKGTKLILRGLLARPRPALLGLLDLRHNSLNRGDTKTKAVADRLRSSCSRLKCALLL